MVLEVRASIFKADQFVKHGFSDLIIYILIAIQFAFFLHKNYRCNSYICRTMTRSMHQQLGQSIHISCIFPKYPE